MRELSQIGTKDIIDELISRGEGELDNEGQYLIYTGIYEKEAHV